MQPIQSAQSVENRKTLFWAKTNQAYQIVRIHDLMIAKRLFSMGLLPGTTITLVRKGFLSGTCYVKSGAITIALRKEEAASIEVA